MTLELRNVSKRFPGLLAAILLGGGSLFGQTPSFEVASIRPSQPIDPAMLQSGKVHRGMMISGNRVDIGNFRLMQLIMKAWDVEMYQVQGPPWLMTGQAFDIVADFPEGATKEQVPGMLQKLLADRFKLQVHMDKQPHDVYALVVQQDGSKLKESALAPDTAPEGVTGSSTTSINQDKNGGAVVTDGTGSKYTMTPSPDGRMMHYEASGSTMAEWLKALSPLSDRPIVDETGLKGRYDVTMDISMQDLMTAVRSAGANVPPPAAGGTDALEPSGSLFTAIKSMGLKLERRKVPMLVVVVDHCEKMPTPN